jgi:catechol 2,3-dioxygenase-like lactoylglutathione lyase family enzyme
VKRTRPTMLSHVAYVTHDTAATAQFYSDVLGMELVNAVLDDSIPSTGDPVPYFHSFFRMADGSTVAFFEAPELPPEPAPSHPAYDIFRHLAMQVDTTEEVEVWRDWLVENGVDVLGPVDHKIVYSIYFHDPNGNRLEITAPVDPDWNNRGEQARESLAEWEQVKATARQTGRDITTVLKELTVERSHRRASGLTID